VTTATTRGSCRLGSTATTTLHGCLLLSSSTTLPAPTRFGGLVREVRPHELLCATAAHLALVAAHTPSRTLDEAAGLALAAEGALDANHSRLADATTLGGRALPTCSGLLLEEVPLAVPLPLHLPLH
jgi:hypothetical protein